MLFSEETIHRRFRFDFGSSEIVVVVRQPTASELSEFLKARFVQRRNKVISRHQEARLEFVDKILTDVEQASFKGADGQVHPLTCQTELTEGDRAKWTRLLGWEVLHLLGDSKALEHVGEHVAQREGTSAHLAHACRVLAPRARLAGKACRLGIGL